MTIVDLDPRPDPQATRGRAARSDAPTASTVTVRLPARTTDTYPAPRPASTDDLARVAALWQDPVLREAVMLASPDLAASADAVVAGRTTAPKRLAALRRSLLKYAIRASTRPTPFGLFSGVAAAEFGPGPLTVAERGHRKNVRLGQPVVRELRRRAEGEPGRLHVSLNPVAVVREDRLYLPFREGDKDGQDTRVDVKLGPALAHVLEVLQGPTLVGDLVASLRDRFAGAERSMIEGFVSELISTGVLLTELAPSAFDDDPAARLLAHGDEATADVQVYRERYTSTDLGEGRPGLAELLEHLEAIDDQGLQRGLQVDLAFSCEGGLPLAVRRTAVDLADALCRLTTFVAESPGLTRHADRFVERFGDVEVPLLEALDPVLGIGMPGGYPTSTHPAEPMTPVESSELSTLFAALLERARRTGSTTVAIGDDELNALPVRGATPASVDLFLQLAGDGDAPMISLGATGAAMPAGRSSGRFAAATPALADHMRRCARHDEDSHPRHLLLELDYLSALSAANNVALAPSVYRHRLALTSPPRDSTDRTVHDLLLGVEEGRFYLRDRVTGAQVLTRRSNLVTTTIAADLVRFLEEVSDDGLVRPSWTWGGLEGRLDFYPEVTARGVVLSPAKWRVPATVTDPATARAWHATAGLPRFCYVGSEDNRLLLDLSDEEHLDLLVREVTPGLSYVLAAPHPTDLGLAHGAQGRRYATEVVVSVLRTPPGTLLPVPPVKPLYDATEQSRFLAPGDRWWYADVYCEPGSQPAVLTAVRDELGAVPGGWFFIRYQDGRHHLRVRLRAETTDPAALSAVLSALRSRRLVSTFTFRPYERELERYGGAALLDVCEHLFCVETALLAAHPQLCAPASAMRTSASVDTADLERGLALCEAWISGLGIDDDTIREMLGLAVTGYQHEFSERSPALRKAVRGLRPADLGPAGDDVVGLLPPALQNVTQALAADTNVNPHSVRLSLLHMWCNRLGWPRDREYQLIFAAHQRLMARRHRGDQQRGTTGAPR